MTDLTVLLLLVLGVGSVVFGVSLVSVPAAFITAGLVLIAGAWLLVDDGKAPSR